MPRGRAMCRRSMPRSVRRKGVCLPIVCAPDARWCEEENLRWCAEDGLSIESQDCSEEEGTCDPVRLRCTETPLLFELRLTWDTPGDENPLDTGAGAGSDVDLHLLHPNGVWDISPWDCHWKNKAPNWGDSGSREDDPNMVDDDTDGWGPELIRFVGPEAVEYAVGVHYFSDHDYGPSDVTLIFLVDGTEELTATRTGLLNRQFWDIARIDGETGEATLVDELYPSGFP